MKIFFLLFATLIFSSFISFPVFAAQIDNNAPVVKLRYDDPNKNDDGCMEAGIALNNCFTTGASLLNWISQVRKPAINGSLLVDIGPGTFTGFNGFDACNVSMRGSGRQKTIIDRGTFAYALSFSATCNADFSSMTFQSNGGLGGINPAAMNAVTTTWTDVEVISTAYGWTESCTTPNTAKHMWFNSRIITSTGVGIARAYSTCSENWFFGSEITAIATGGNQAFAFGLKSNETHVYGSVIRAIANPGVILPSAALSGAGIVSGLVAISVEGGGKFHVHGSGIDVQSTEANNIAVLGAAADTMIHANESAYNLSTGTGGTITRILNPNGLGHVHAPYLWEHIPKSPLISVTGADMTTVTTNTSDGQPHLAIYSTNCPSGWYDAVDKTCRP